MLPKLNKTQIKKRVTIYAPMAGTQCGECKKSFSKIGNLRAHVKRAHPGTSIIFTPKIRNITYNSHFRQTKCFGPKKDLRARRHLHRVQQHLREHQQPERPHSNKAPRSDQKYNHSPHFRPLLLIFLQIKPSARYAKAKIKNRRRSAST